MEEYQNNEITGDAEKIAQSVKGKVTEKMKAVREKAGEAVSKAGEAVSRIREEGSLTDLYKDTKGYVRDYPGPSLLVALAVGYMLGVVFRRQR